MSVGNATIELRVARKERTAANLVVLVGIIPFSNLAKSLKLTCI